MGRGRFAGTRYGKTGDFVSKPVLAEGFSNIGQLSILGLINGNVLGLIVSVAGTSVPPNEAKNSQDLPYG
jgi:hypothetical protein